VSGQTPPAAKGTDGFYRGHRQLTLAIAVVVAAAVAVTVVLLQPDDHSTTSAAHGTGRQAAIAVQAPGPGQHSPAGATVTASPGTSPISVPRSFLGVSTEYWAMPVFDRHRELFERVLSLLRVPGDGPLVIRIGGDSADHSLLDINLPRAPRGIFELTPAWFRNTSLNVRDLDAQTILDLNLVTDLPWMAAQWARAAETQLPAGSIMGYEIGNEPDLYNPSYWSEIFSPLQRMLGIRLLPGQLTPSTYTRLFSAYAEELATYAPHIPLLGPVVAYPVPHLNWLATLLAGPHPGLGIVSAHEYPYSACAEPGSPLYPTVGRLLSEQATAGMAQSLRPATQLAHREGFSFRLTELNSVTCGGVAGVSDTFVTALWAPDALFELMRAGVDGIHVHVRANAINAAFAPTGHGFAARPLLYGLILFARTLGPDPELVDLRVHARPGDRLKVWAVRIRGGALHVLLINKGERPVDARLLIPGTGAATVERLVAPGAAARAGISLGGQRLGPYDNWLGRPADQRVTQGPSGYELTVAPTSAALVSVHLRAGALCC
jgi:hypothetical protein